MTVEGRERIVRKLYEDVYPAYEHDAATHDDHTPNPSGDEGNTGGDGHHAEYCTVLRASVST